MEHCGDLSQSLSFGWLSEASIDFEHLDISLALYNHEIPPCEGLTATSVLMALGIPPGTQEGPCTDIHLRDFVSSVFQNSARLKTIRICFVTVDKRRTGSADTSFRVLSGERLDGDEKLTLSDSVKPAAYELLEAIIRRELARRRSAIEWDYDFSDEFSDHSGDENYDDFVLDHYDFEYDDYRSD
jgi:hypothetical protein